MVLDKMPNSPESKFRVPYLSGKYILPIVFIGAVAIILHYIPSYFQDLLVLESSPMILFWIVTTVVVIYTFLRDFSLIPLLGLVSCFYLMAQETHLVWIRFLAWLIIGLIIYFLYSYKNSKLSPARAAEIDAARSARNDIL